MKKKYYQVYMGKYETLNMDHKFIRKLVGFYYELDGKNYVVVHMSILRAYILSIILRIMNFGFSEDYNIHEFDIKKDLEL